MKKLLTSILLNVVAIILYLIVMPCAIVYMIIKLILKKQYIEIISAFTTVFKTHAIGIDQIGNGAFNIFFNDIFIKDKTILPFGRVDETISIVIGKNKLINNLSIFGKTFDFILNLIDKNHTIKSIDS